MSLPRSSGWQILARSARHWDLWASVPTAGVPVTVLAWTETVPPWGAALAGFPAFTGLSWAAWRQLSQREDRLSNEAYGEMVSMVDPRNEELSAPYQVTMYVALAAGIASVAAALLLPIVKVFAWDIAIVSVTAWLWAWGLLTYVSLLVIDREHSKNAAEMQALQRGLEAHHRHVARTGSTQSS